MTIDEAMEMVKEKLTCMTLEDLSCIEKGCDRDCDNCVHNYGQGTSGEQKEALSIAIKALEEIQQYRAIGTPEECRAAVEKKKAKKVKIIEEIRTDGITEYFAVCKSCNSGSKFCVGIRDFRKSALSDWKHIYYCDNCGQKLDWSDEE